MEDALNGNKGCKSNIITNPVTSYWMNCETPLQGFWVIKITADYEFHQVSGYTYLFLI